jgi:PadR family transcriptional regulator, regulatory protein PadR
VVLSRAKVKVLGVFLADPTAEQYGFGLMRATKVPAGTLYPMLERLEELGWIESHDEEIDERAAGRPRRRLYRLTGVGIRQATEAVEEFYRDLGVAPSWRPGWEGS